MTNFFDEEPRPEHDELDDLEVERPELSLSLDQQAAMAAAVQARLRSCDGTLSAAHEWAQGAGIDWPRLRRELEENGGYCDCEVVLTVFGGDVDRIFDAGGAEPD
jgi:Protein of unknown function (DUF2695)